MPNKVPCLEGDIPVKIIKVCFSVNGQYLLRISNNSLTSGVVPASWKRAIVIPLYKKGDPGMAFNFRPVTNIPIVTKIVEKLVSQQLTDYLNSEHLYSDDQHGSRAHHSTGTALLSVTDEILKGMDRSEITLLTLIDFNRCFDVVDHKTLLNKLVTTNLPSMVWKFSQWPCPTSSTWWNAFGPSTNQHRNISGYMFGALTFQHR